MRKRLLALVVVVLAGSALVACLSLYRRPPSARFTREMARQIHRGMTEAEVVTVLGWPAGNHASPGTGYIPETDGIAWGADTVWPNPQGLPLVSGETLKGWISDEGIVCVKFDANGRATQWDWFPVLRPPSPAEQVWDGLRSLLPPPASSRSSSG
jgi:hypothetical protein